jgi:hypothetical protein
MKKLPKNTTLWALLLLFALLMILPGCTGSKPSRRDLQLQHYADSLTASRASKITDRQAAVAAIGMLNACECALTDSTIALQRTREKAKKDVKSAQTGGIILGGLGGLLGFMIYAIFN